MKKIKVIHFISGLKAGGVESMIINFAKLLQDYFEFTVVYQHKPDEKCYQKMVDAGCKLKRIPSKSKHPFKNIKEINKIFKKEKYDIVHSHMNLTCWIPLMIARFNGIKNRVSHSHIAKNEGSGIKYKVFANVSKFLVKASANYYCACGEDAATYMYGTGFKEDKKHYIIHNAVNIDDFKFTEKVRDDYRKEMKLEDKYVVGHIGRFTEQKNHKFLIDIFEGVSQRIDNAVLLLIGTGELYDEVYDYVKLKKLDDKVIFMGSRNDVCNIIQAMDVFILPSLYEGLPVVSIEAQASGVSCLFADTIDKKCKLIENADFLPIDKGVGVWVDRIMDCRNRKLDRNSVGKQVRDAGYDINKEVLKLKKMYFQIIQR